MSPATKTKTSCTITSRFVNFPKVDFNQRKEKVGLQPRTLKYWRNSNRTGVLALQYLVCHVRKFYIGPDGQPKKYGKVVSLITCGRERPANFLG